MAEPESVSRQWVGGGHGSLQGAAEEEGQTAQ